MAGGLSVHDLTKTYPTAGGDLTVVSMLISEQANRLLDWPLASALAIVVLLLTIVVFALLRLSQLASRRRGKARAGAFA